MFKTTTDIYRLVDWMVFNGEVPANLSKADLIGIMAFIIYQNSGDFTTELPKKLVKKTINGLIPDHTVNCINGKECYIITTDYLGGYHEKSDTNYLDNPKALLAFKKRALTYILNLPEYN